MSCDRPEGVRREVDRARPSQTRVRFHLSPEISDSMSEVCARAWHERLECGMPYLAAGWKRPAGCTREHQEPRPRPLEVTREGWWQKWTVAGVFKSDPGGETSRI